MGELYQVDEDVIYVGSSSIMYIYMTDFIFKEDRKIIHREQNNLVERGNLMDLAVLVYSYLFFIFFSRKKMFLLSGEDIPRKI